MTHPRVRVATPDDHEPVSRLFAVSYSRLMRSHYDDTVLDAALPLITRANPMLLCSGSFFVAETSDGIITGCGGWTRARPGTGEVAPGLGHVRHFAVHPDHGGQGIGRSLYRVCEKQALSAGVERFECYASLNAEGFYASLGFQNCGALNVRLWEGICFPGILMTHSLA